MFKNEDVYIYSNTYNKSITVIHKPSNTKVTVSEYDSRLKNKKEALIKLFNKLKNK